MDVKEVLLETTPANLKKIILLLRAAMGEKLLPAILSGEIEASHGDLLCAMLATAADYAHNFIGPVLADDFAKVAREVYVAETKRKTKDCGCEICTSVMAHIEQEAGHAKSAQARG